MVVIVGAGFLFATDTGRQVLDDVTGRVPGASGPVDTVPVPPPASDASTTTSGLDSTADVAVPFDARIGRTPASDLVTGSCYDSTTAEGDGDSFDVTGVTERPCTEPHQKEALAVVQLGDDRFAEYPGPAAVMAALQPTCDRARARVIWVDPDEWAFATIHPSPESWAAGDRQGICEVARRDGSLLQDPLVDPTNTPG